MLEPTQENLENLITIQKELFDRLAACSEKGVDDEGTN
jgi:hypothetical protein